MWTLPTGYNHLLSKCSNHVIINLSRIYNTDPHYYGLLPFLGGTTGLKPGLFFFLFKQCYEIVNKVKWQVKGAKDIKDNLDFLDYLCYN